MKLKVYRKKAHTGQYLHFTSHHPLHQKLGVHRTLIDRAENIVTDSEDLSQEKAHVNSCLKQCGYPDWSLRKTEKNSEPKTKKDKPTDRSQRKGMVTIPYIKGTSEALQRIFRKYNIASAMRPLSKLRSLLVHPKDKRSLEESTGVVYQIPCTDCKQTYIGETARKFGVRRAEHKKEADQVGKAHFTRSQKSKLTPP